MVSRKCTTVGWVVMHATVLLIHHGYSAFSSQLRYLLWRLSPHTPVRRRPSHVWELPACDFPCVERWLSTPWSTSLTCDSCFWGEFWAASRRLFCFRHSRAGWLASIESRVCDSGTLLFGSADVDFATYYGTSTDFEQASTAGASTQRGKDRALWRY